MSKRFNSCRCAALPMTGNSPRDFRAFLDSFSSQDALQYAGEWIAVACGEIVAHGKDPGRVHMEGCNAGKGGPFMHYVFANAEEASHWCTVEHDP